MQDGRLRLHQEVTLLALKDERGTVTSGVWLRQAAAGAILAELLLAGRITLTGEGKKREVEVLSTEPVGDPLLDEALQKIVTSRKVRRLSHWASSTSNLDDLKRRLAEGLVERGILRAETDKVLLLFSREVYPEVDPEPERELRERLRRAVLEEGEVDERTAVLLSLTKGTGLLELVLDKRERKEHKERIEAVVNGEACGKAVRDLVQSVQAAVFVVCIMPAVIH